MNLVKTPFAPLPLLSITSEAEDRRNELVQSALAIEQIACADENDMARNVAVEIRHHLKDVESTRTQLTRPLLDAQRMLKKLADDHVLPLTTALARLERMATVFAVSEKERMEAEEKAKADLASEAKSMEELQSVIAMPIQDAAKARGQQLRKVLRWEVTDLMALVKARPDLCSIEPKASAIQSTCIPEMPNLPPGLKLWWEDKTTFTSR